MTKITKTGLIVLTTSIFTTACTPPETIKKEKSTQISQAQRKPIESKKSDREFFNTSVASVHASPSVRKLSRELGVDLNQVNGSGMKGRILPEDLKSFVKAAMSGNIVGVQSALPELPVVDHSAFGDIESVPLSRIKKISGPRLQASWINIPHVTQHDEADINQACIHFTDIITHLEPVIGPCVRKHRQPTMLQCPKNEQDLLHLLHYQ